MKRKLCTSDFNKKIIHSFIFFFFFFFFLLFFFPFELMINHEVMMNWSNRASIINHENSVGRQMHTNDQVVVVVAAATAAVAVIVVVTVINYEVTNTTGTTLQNLQLL